MAPTHQIEHFAFCGCPPHDANQIEISHYEAFHREHRGKKTLPNFRLLRTFFELVYIFEFPVVTPKKTSAVGGGHPLAELFVAVTILQTVRSLEISVGN